MGEDRTIEEKRGAAARLVTRMLHGYFAISRGMTLGVRAACYDEAGRIFLVRHSYVPGWHMPGGGVERRETALQALSKELREEGNLEMTSPAQLFHVYFNTRVSRRDHVLFYRANVLQTAPRKPDLEIVESGFFALHDLPHGVTPATQRRLRELSGEVPPDDLW
ncbi:MAG TPA: NUDIX domain-containing protein [Rhizobium sp.]|nr:NUDIX domain-containing protein [Rhizobium sp.]